MTETAANRLRQQMDQALAHAAKTAGKPLEWSEHEIIAIERAC